MGLNSSYLLNSFLLYKINLAWGKLKGVDIALLQITISKLKPLQYFWKVLDLTRLYHQIFDRIKKLPYWQVQQWFSTKTEDPTKNYKWFVFSALQQNSSRQDNLIHKFYVVYEVGNCKVDMQCIISLQRPCKGFTYVYLLTYKHIHRFILQQRRQVAGATAKSYGSRGWGRKRGQS